MDPTGSLKKSEPELILFTLHYPFLFSAFESQYDKSLADDVMKR